MFLGVHRWLCFAVVDVDYRTVCFLTCGPTRVGFVWQVVAATFWLIGNYRTSPWANRKHLLASFRRNSWIIQCFKHQRDSATVFAFCSPNFLSRPEPWGQRGKSKAVVTLGSRPLRRRGRTWKKQQLSSKDEKMRTRPEYYAKVNKTGVQCSSRLTGRGRGGRDVVASLLCSSFLLPSFSLVVPYCHIT